MSPDGFVSHVPCRPIELSAHANEKRSSQEDLFGWKKGLEPSTFGTTIRRSNRLSYIHRVDTSIVDHRECKCNTIFRSVQKKRLKNRPEISGGINDKVVSGRCICRLVKCVLSLVKICQKTVGTSIDGDRGCESEVETLLNITYNKFKITQAMNVKPLSDRVLILPESRRRRRRPAD